MRRPALFIPLVFCFLTACLSFSCDGGKEKKSYIPAISFSLEIPDSFKNDAGIPTAPARVFVFAPDFFSEEGKLLDYAWEVNGKAAGEGKARWLALPSPGSNALELRVSDSSGNYRTRREEIHLAEGPVLFLSGRVYPVRERRAVDTVSLYPSSGDIIPGEVIVRFREKEAAFRSSMAAEGLQELERSKDRALLRVSPLRNTMGLNGHSDPMEASVEETLAAVEALHLRRDVLWAEPNYRRRIFRIPVNDAAYAEDPRRFWPLEAIAAPDAWEQTRGAGTVIAVLDSGVMADHPDLKGRIGPDGHDFVNKQAGTPSDESPFHGTQVAGIALATMDNGLGIAGVAGEATLMPLRVIKNDSASTWDIAQAIRYAAGLENASGRLPQRRADVINLSLGGTFHSREERSAVEAALEAGVFVVAAAGNEGRDRKNYPAAHRGVFAVAGVDQGLMRHPDSNYGDWISLAAPFGPVHTTSAWSLVRPQASYADVRGTSMAAPFVSGVLALMRSLDPFLSPEQAMGILEKGGMTRDLGPLGKDAGTGWGLVDAAKALESLVALAVAPEALYMGMGGDQALFFLGKGNGGAGMPVSSLPWLGIREAAHGLNTRTFAVSLDREHGDFPETGGRFFIAIPGDSGDSLYPVHVNMPPADLYGLSRDHVFVVLEQEGAGKKRYYPLNEEDRDGGAWLWRMEDVEPGLYRVRIQGEGLKGAYPSGEGRPVWVFPGAPGLEHLDFVVEVF
ncbi:subtilase family protein [Desulfobotulus alkaliphilus]|uniref:Subtilase family protein n=1 Tax=Desulfobotulus alkaliphilus TaxID=622671 RepID=A0A562S2M1_9BACT|nr:S8 family serine peptidase [Desulfobotulus alkaliphilus]TWI75388.1 subtilase family protein [Desulfobotulus alkaliphilus]